MTDAGWTAEVKQEGWYWWRGEFDEVVEIYEVAGTLVIARTSMGVDIQLKEFIEKNAKGLFKGPLSPTDRQQGRVEGLREAAKEVLRQAHAIDAANKFNEMADALAQAAQDEKEVGDGKV